MYVDVLPLPVELYRKISFYLAAAQLKDKLQFPKMTSQAGTSVARHIVYRTNALVWAIIFRRDEYLKLGIFRTEDVKWLFDDIV